MAQNASTPAQPGKKPVRSGSHPAKGRGGNGQNRHNNGQSRPNQPNNSRNTQKPRQSPIKATTRRSESVRAQARVSQDAQRRSTGHMGNIPVNKSIYNGRQGRQLSVADLKKVRRDPKAVRVIPIGGLGERGIGMNMTAIEYGDEIIVIDMGSIFPSGNDYPGINLMTPDISYLEANKHKIKGILFTHAHLDHVGSCRYLLSKLPAPIYATKFTNSMIQRQMTEAEDTEYQPRYVDIDPFKHERIHLGKSFDIEFVHVLHSIPGCVAIVIRTPNGTIVHMGDWRFENDPVSPQFDMPRLLEISQKEGIALMLNESTNIGVPGTHPHSEFTVGDNISEILEHHQHGRVVVSCFSSQLYRIQLVLDAAKKHGRKVALAGFSMLTNVEVALRSQELKIPKDTIIKMEDAVRLPDSQVMILCTGSQGEPNAVLHRMATGAHKHIKIKATDCVVFSSSPIPGNEPSVVNVVDGLMREGSTVVQHGKTHLHGFGPLHLSGHAYYEDHVKLVTALKPRAYLPIHGEYHMLENNARMAENVAGIPRDQILVVDDGDIVELHEDGKVGVAGRIKTGSVLRDGQGRVINESVIKDRLHISTEGIFTVVATISKKDGRLLKNPDIISRASVYLRDNEDLMGDIRVYLRRQFTKKRQIDDDFKKELRDDIAHLIYDRSGNSPVVLVVVNQV